MSFAGDLEHLPIVDVIQLLHSTRMTGTLYLKSDRGESQIVFVDGFIVSANHVDNSIRIGQILVGMGLITAEYLEKSLSIQQSAGPKRKPLIATLIEGNQLKKEDAYKGLESLIEMSIVEILTWTKGIFRLDVKTTTISDEYRYLPEILKQEINLNTQSVLMDALRIYDEKMRNGTLEDGIFATLEQTAENAFNAQKKDNNISVDILGLDRLDAIEKKIPDVYSGLRDYEFSDYQPNKDLKDSADTDLTEQNKIFSYLMEFSYHSKSLANKLQSSIRNNVILIYSLDQFLNRIIMTTCKYEGLHVSAITDEFSLNKNIESAISRSISPLIIFDVPNSQDVSRSEASIITLLMQIREKYPDQVSCLQLFNSEDKDFPMRALLAGANNIFPRPATDGQQVVFTEDVVNFLKVLQKHFQTTVLKPSELILNHFKECMTDLAKLRDATKLAYIPLKFSSTMFERSITFFVGKSELIAKNEIGISSHQQTGTHPPMSLRIPLDQPSILQEIVQSGNFFYGEKDDILLHKLLFNDIGMPLNHIYALIPIISFGKVAAVIYADFGQKKARSIQIELLNVVAKTTGLALDNCLYRKQLVKQKKPL